ncbi:MAG: 30S ribosomal protein THX [SAR324 cluster bacterium]|uniref:30S ribosomal protein THX n=1 Tax=SAR324 cluster bacterium TaxID=2024889 RepID=A0A7X9FR41_9DELT|nr:30S ribosomal protein THX [SAR324 cluster bacterium]
MGRGDKKTKKGKIFKGSYGNVRPKASKVKKAKAAAKKKK